MQDTRPTAPELDAALDAPWAMGAAAYHAAAAYLRRIDPRTIVEFGSGVSTAALARDFPDARILSIDHDPRFVGETRERLARSPGVDVSHRPLTWQHHVGLPYLSYAQGPLPPVIDAILVDGPPHWTRRGREATLLQALPYLRVGGLVILDDLERRGERRMLAHWLRTFRGSLELVEILDTGHRLAVLRRTDVLPPRDPDLRQRLDVRLNAAVQPAASRLRTFMLSLRSRV
jgi:predicted O-methyltransferase YrrM